jgi:ketosteroid isomerase-like protein
MNQYFKKSVLYRILPVATGVALVLLISCKKEVKVNKDQVMKEILSAEKAFEKMAGDISLAEAFYSFAADSAVIKRQNDTLILGREGIRNYYDTDRYKKARLKWTPDFVDVSKDGSMGYTYGSFVWINTDSTGTQSESRGVYHTVWKRQKDGTWKFVWD